MLLQSGEVIRIEKKFYGESDIVVKGKKIDIIEPINSVILNMFKVIESKKETITANLNSVKCKMLLLLIFELSTDNAEQFVVPLLHMHQYCK